MILYAFHFLLTLASVDTVVIYETPNELNYFSDIIFSADPQAVLPIHILLICLVAFFEVK
jgi:hypothetical protein